MTEAAVAQRAEREGQWCYRGFESAVNYVVILAQEQNVSMSMNMLHNEDEM